MNTETQPLLNETQASVASVTAWLESHPEHLEKVAQIVRRMQAQQYFAKLELTGPDVLKKRRWMSWVTDWQKNESQHADQFVIFQQPDSLLKLCVRITHEQDPYKPKCANGSIDLDGKYVFLATSDFTEGWNNICYEDFHIDTAYAAHVLQSFFEFKTENDAHAWCEMLEQNIFGSHDATFSWQMGQIKKEITQPTNQPTMQPSSKRYKTA